MRERGNPALPRQIVADESDFPNFSSPRHGCHKTLILTPGRFTSGADSTLKSSPSCPHPGSSCLEPGRRRDCGCTAARHYGLPSHGWGNPPPRLLISLATRPIYHLTVVGIAFPGWFASLPRGRGRGKLHRCVICTIVTI